MRQTRATGAASLTLKDGAKFLSRKTSPSPARRLQRIKKLKRQIVKPPGCIFNPFPNQAQVSACRLYKSFENTVGKGEIARNEQFLLFPRCFQKFWLNFLPISSNLILSSANSFSLEESSIYRLGKGYTLYHSILTSNINNNVEKGSNFLSSS